MSITSTFANALTGLRANSKLTEVTSNNLANALTDGYGRQEVVLSSQALGGQGAGVSVTSLVRAQAPEATAARRQADGDAAASSAQADALARLGQSLGEATDPDGLFRRLEGFETSLRQFAETPESGPRQSLATEAARDLASVLNSLSSEAAIVRQNADAAIFADVNRVNQNLAEIERLNAEIQTFQVTDISVPTLVDQRERLIDEVNAIIPVKVQPKANGVIHLYTAEGQFVLQDQAVTLEFTPSPVITTAMMYDPAGGGALSGLTLNGQDLTPGGTGVQRIKGGSLAGNFAVRDSIGTTFNTRIDQFSADLIARFEDPTVDPTLTAGDPGLFTDAGGALDPLNIEGLAGRISINALVDPSQGGDPARLRDGLQSVAPGPVNSDVIARNLLDALRRDSSAAAIPGLSGNLSLSQIASGIVEATGIERVTAEATAARQNSAREVLADGEAGRIGVNSDEELQTLILVEQAFAANAQVIQTASRMLDEVLEIR